MKTKTTAALLAFFLGALGIHRFYLRQPGFGVLYLLFFWTLIPSFISFIDFIVFLSMSDRAFDEKYNWEYYGQSQQYRQEQMPRQAPQQLPPPISTESDLDKLEKLARLRAIGAITDQEFQERKYHLRY